MVSLSIVKQANDRFAKNDAGNAQGLVCVFAGATSNLGAGAIEHLAAILSGPTFYILGRSATRFAEQRKRLLNLNPSLKVVFLEVEVSLISGIDAACQSIASAETKVDYLFMSQGCIPLTVPQCIHITNPFLFNLRESLTGHPDTTEGIDLCFALSYFSRTRLVVNLLPLLRQSSRPRVLSVLNGGREKAVLEDDIGLENPDHYAPRAAINHTTLMMSLVLELLASNNQQITFMHSFPGLVTTDNFARLTAPQSYGLMGRLILLIFSRFISMVQRLFGMSAADCGARQAFLLASDKFPAGGAWRIDQRSDPVTDSRNGVLADYRNRGWRDKVWDHTMRVFEKVVVN